MSKETKSTKNLFVRNLELTNKEIKGKRAIMYSEDAEIASQTFLDNLTTKRRNLNRSLLDLEDFHPETNTSLRVTKSNFDAQSWVSQMNRVQLDLALIEAEIKIAEAIHNKYFN